VWVVAALLLLFVALSALVLAIPVDLDARIEVHGRPSSYVTLAWLFGRVKKTFHSGQGEEKRSEGRAAKKSKARKKASGKKASWRTGRLVLRLVRSRGLVRSVGRLVVRLIRCIRVRRLELDFAADLGDPADTAMIVGALSQLARMVGSWSPWSFRLRPAFYGEPLLDGEVALAVRVRPICALPPVLAFLFSPSMLMAILLVLRSRWQ
jgi:hypothetical protein